MYWLALFRACQLRSSRLADPASMVRDGSLSTARMGTAALTMEASDEYLAFAGGVRFGSLGVDKDLDHCILMRFIFPGTTYAR